VKPKTYGQRLVLIENARAAGKKWRPTCVFVGVILPRSSSYWLRRSCAGAA
jgi:hypothetical protein